MATEQGYKYYSKAEIDESFYNKAGVDALLAVEDVDFTLKREDAGPYTTTISGKKIHLGGDVYAYVCKATASGSGFSVSSTGNKHYTITYPTAFTTLFGGAANGAFSGQTESYKKHCDVRQTLIDIYVESAGSGDVIVSFIVIGEITND